MATPLISHPFRLMPSGKVFTRDQTDQDYKAERLALLCTIQPGERVLVPGYGISDPAFAGFDENMLRTQIVLYGPQVTVTGVSIKNISDLLQRFDVKFDTSEADAAETFNNEMEV